MYHIINTHIHACLYIFIYTIYISIYIYIRIYIYIHIISAIMKMFLPFKSTANMPLSKPCSPLACAARSCPTSSAESKPS